MKDYCRTVVDLLSWGRAALAEAGKENARKEAEILLAFCMGVKTKDLLLGLNRPVSTRVEEKYARLVQRRCAKYPLQYLTGVQEFMALEFEVNEAVLIPRWDTERLVELVLDRMARFEDPVVADVGTGSGAIVVSLAKYFPRGKYYALDLSAEALEVARRNAGRHGVEDKIAFLRGNLLEPLWQPGGPGERICHIVVSNPPYIPRKEIPHLPPDVQKEPSIALDGGDDGLSCYRALLPQAERALRPGGYIFLEIGFNQGEAVSSLCRAHGFSEVAVVKDYGRRDRVVSGVLRGE